MIESAPPDRTLPAPHPCRRALAVATDAACAMQAHAADAFERAAADRREIEVMMATVRAQLRALGVVDQPRVALDGEA